MTGKKQIRPNTIVHVRIEDDVLAEIDRMVVAEQRRRPNRTITQAKLIRAMIAVGLEQHRALSGVGASFVGVGRKP